MKLIVTSILVFVCQLVWAQPHTWIFKTGITFGGEFVSSDATNVIVSKGNRNYSMKISDLATEDQTYVAELQNAQRQADFDLAWEERQFEAKHAGNIGVRMTGTNRPVEIISILDKISNHGIPLCVAHGISQRILVRDLPVSLMDFVDRENKLLSDINDLKDKISRDESSAEYADAIAPRTDASVAVQDENITYVTPVVTDQRARANLMAVQVADEQRKLEKMQDSLNELEAGSHSSGTVIACPTTEFYGGYQVWYCD